ncbi:MAG TPA: uracil-DNA glycosylase family protein [Sandaracinaceae bacterium LLY-WYZ-13_1]|nr:uracil-DNA glycosylase family protein [Sandaracinaceae bacterium LLY-WYZ-13_1]
MSAEHDAELAELARLTAEHLRWEMDLGNRALPDVRAALAEARADAAGEAEAAGPGASADARSARGAAGEAPGERAGPTADEPDADERAISARAGDERAARPEGGGDQRAARGGGPERAGDERAARGGGDAHAAVSSADDRGADDRVMRLRVLAEEAAACTACGLHAGRTRSVFARGDAHAPLCFVGEGPGYHEDQQGVPFVGRAGQLLDKMIAAMGFEQDEVYVCNVVKCRPPNNRTPNPDEAAACMRFLREQLALVQPQVIVALGRHAASNLGVAEPGRRWRGVWGRFEGIRVMPTYHPAYLLRSPEQKRPVWQDLQQVVAAMGRELPDRRG